MPQDFAGDVHDSNAASMNQRLRLLEPALEELWPVLFMTALLSAIQCPRRLP
jgi:hypothetical protein